MDSESVCQANKEKGNTKVRARIKKTGNIKGEQNGWQMLADMIVLQAVKDYRSRNRMMMNIKRQIAKSTLSEDERLCLTQRLHKYEGIQDKEADFFFSPLFAILTDIDGYGLLDKLEKEAGR